MLDLLYDATEIDTWHGLAQIVFYAALLRDFMKSLVEVYDPAALRFKGSVVDILRWVKRHG